ncbi:MULTISPECIES: hypothetical protein [Pseudomonas]|uniref:hypothetical protein n=1 Tax=Pseudomonas TaxID=286 RepID=UPI000000F78D|nr:MULTISPECIES: hypothetical protein [Pseudomonas]MDD2079573.1 hypothetical protein [Pseudomonas putida]QXZ06309.1 hypothetical protein HG554_19140 [Pseudomonas putida]UUX22675.1 hypothetical protein M8Z99_19190 [Pseudomonas putida]UUX28154.1 hypothetical protein M8003_19195 [Pseudomonas putida]UUX66757.1 hypothetical protein M8001_19195 [Pseudomonas putida]
MIIARTSAELRAIDAITLETPLITDEKEYPACNIDNIRNIQQNPTKVKKS